MRLLLNSRRAGKVSLLSEAEMKNAQCFFSQLLTGELLFSLEDKKNQTSRASFPHAEGLIVQSGTEYTSGGPAVERFRVNAAYSHLLSQVLLLTMVPPHVW